MMNLRLITSILIVAGFLAGCGKQGGNEGASVTYVKTLSGAGASFPVPVYDVWRYEWGEKNNVTVNYNSVGSGAGIQRIKAKTVDFGASDAPLKEDELEEAGLVQWPMLIGGVVPVINIEGIEAGELKLTSEALAGIYLGDITTWNDPAITEHNPGLDLPDAKINVVRRSDSSGTTWIFTSYLSRVSEKWAQGPGWSKTPQWPVGTGAPKNPGVADLVQNSNNSIGYVESAFQKQTGLPYPLLRNQAGKFVDPSMENVQAAAANADWKNAPGLYVVLTNQPGEKSWPIAGATYLLVHKEQDDKAEIQTLLSWVDWCYRKGDSFAKEKNYIPMPDNVVALVEELWAEKITVDGQPVWPIKTQDGQKVAAVE